MDDRFTQLRNEAAVELRVIVPLIEDLGYDLEDISPKHPVTFQEGRTGRKHEADFVLFAGPLHNEDTSLVVVEAKPPAGDLDEGRRQAESYALTTRAPILLTCDGVTLEVWQLNLSRSSDRVLTFPVSEIDARRGELERYLRKETVISYCRTVCGRTIVEATADFGAYEAAELRRTLQFERAIDRRLRNLETQSAISSADLIRMAPSGAVIVAPSGFGKTSFSNKLLRAHIAARWRDGPGRIPILVPSLDLQPGEPLLSFAAKRLTPHNPSVTQRSILNFLNEQGLALILDEFDRLVDADRSSRAAELRNLLRDHERLSIFVFSRMSAKPALALPTYELDVLDDEERIAVLQAGRTAGPGTVYHLMPPLLRDLCGNPLLLTLAADHYEATGAFPNRIEELFRTWIDRTLQSDPANPADAARREAALGLIAQRKGRGRTLLTEAVRILSDAGYASTTLDELVRCDALVVSGGVVSFHHEALADYLRALAISRLLGYDLETAIAAAELESGSLFPILLMALLDSFEAQHALWLRLTNIDFNSYLEVLRYRADVSAGLPSAGDDELTRRFLSDLRDGVALPLEGFFKALRRPILTELVGREIDGFSVVGAVDQQSVAYSYVEPETVSHFDADELMNQGYVLRQLYLAPAGLRLDSGRLLGLQNLRDALFKVIEGRHLSGGIEWRLERLTSRFHYLRKHRNVPLAVTAPLPDWQTLLALEKDKAVISDWPQEFLFWVRSLLDDIDALQSAGRDRLDDASPRLAQIAWQNFDQDNFRRAVDDHYRRMQILYREVADTSFSAVRQQLGFYSALPVRWHVTVVHHASNPLGAWLGLHWKPVTSWEQAGADVSFATSLKPWEESDFLRLREELQKLGRLTRYTNIFVASRALVSFSHPYGLTWETESSPFQDACEQIKHDVKQLFRGMPGSDRSSSFQNRILER